MEFLFWIKLHSKWIFCRIYSHEVVDLYSEGSIYSGLVAKEAYTLFIILASPIKDVKFYLACQVSELSLEPTKIKDLQSRFLISCTLILRCNGVFDISSRSHVKFHMASQIFSSFILLTKTY